MFSIADYHLNHHHSYIYIYVYIHMYIYICVCIYINRKDVIDLSYFWIYIKIQYSSIWLIIKGDNYYDYMQSTLQIQFNWEKNYRDYRIVTLKRLLLLLSEIIVWKWALLLFSFWRSRVEETAAKSDLPEVKLSRN